MLRRIILSLMWVGLIVYAFFLSPPVQPNTFDLIVNLSTGKWSGINPLIISLFNIMGIWPMIYAAVLLIDGRMQKVPAWPFLVVSFGVGAFTILPYLIARQPNETFEGEKNRLIQFLDSRWLGIILFLGTVALLMYGLFWGDWQDFIQQWQTSRFIHVMSIDFCLLCLLFPLLLKDDMARRRLKNPTLFWTVSLLPLLGSALYLCVRPSLPESVEEN